MTAPARITLFTPYFAARTPERQRELDLCLQHNVDNEAIARIVLLVDDGHAPPLRHPKLEVQALAARPTYADWVRFSRARADTCITLLANSDIYFDDSVAGLSEGLGRGRRFLALSRYDLQGAALVPHPNPAWSQDVWGYDTRQGIPDNLLKSLDIPLGVPRCDNKVAYHFAVNGWALCNPLRQVRSVHVHETQQRNYDKTADLTVIGAVAYVHPSSSLEATSEVEIDVWALNTKAIRSVKLNRSLENWAAERERGAAASVPVAPPAPSPRAAPAPAPPAPPAPPAATPAPPASAAPPAGAADWPPAGAADWPRFVDAGQRVFDSLHRFAVYRLGAESLAIDWLNPGAAAPLRREAYDAQGALRPEALLAQFVPPLLDTHPISVRERPASPRDSHFWQYPAATEKQAFDNHRRLPPGSNLDPAARIVHTYLGLPWATYIDRKHFPEDVAQWLQPRVLGLRRLAAELGWRLAVHTVCQQIHWRRIVGQLQALQVTDLHLSHAETVHADTAARTGLRLHSWPLIAPNVEDPARSAGLVAGKPLHEKRYLASFIGAHMPHYRSDVRLRLLEAAKASGRSDVLVDLGSEWHFNKVVYKEQVQNKALTATEAQAHDSATQRYNEVLSDSVFSLCPEGAGPNTLRVWESMAVGAIPVILADTWVPPPPTADQPDLGESCVFHPQREVDSLFARLVAMPPAERERRQRACIEAYRRVRLRATYATGAGAC
jgi:hypothetical protein